MNLHTALMVADQKEIECNVFVHTRYKDIKH